MTDPKTISEYTAGLQNIERSVIAKVREAGGTITASNFRWHRGKDWIPPPSAIELEITVQGRTFSAVLSSEQVKDSWQQISRPDVFAVVKAGVAALRS